MQNDSLGRGLIFDRLEDDTDDTKSTKPDINTIPMQDRLASEEGLPSV